MDMLHYFLGYSSSSAINIRNRSIAYINKRIHAEYFMFWFLSSLETRINLIIEEIIKISDK